MDFGLFQTILITSLNESLHNTYQGLHILEVFSKISYQQELFRIRKFDKDLVCL